MKLMEATVYSLIAFVALYILVAASMRVFELTTVYTSHIVAGVSATVVAVLLFVFFLVKQK